MTTTSPLGDVAFMMSRKVVPPAVGVAQPSFTHRQRHAILAEFARSKEAERTKPAIDLADLFVTDHRSGRVEAGRHRPHDRLNLHARALAHSRIRATAGP